MKLKQNKTPLFDALKAYKKSNVIPYDVPGHKHGLGNKELLNFLGEDVLSIDVNSMKQLDNACHPISVIKESEMLLADAFNADYGFFLTNGTTQGVQAMILTVCDNNDKIILPRNVHKSAINALILSGAKPVYINPRVESKLGISVGITVDNIIKVIEENKDAKAIFLTNPTYYGVCSDLEKIIEVAHKYNILVLVDEAHGSHLYFNEELPKGAMNLDADMACISLHKTGGSLTQSSALLVNDKRINHKRIRTVLNLTQTTSGSYLLMTSIDIARKQLALNGKEILDNVLSISRYLRNEINKIDGFYAFGKELLNNDDFYDFDETKLSINTSNLGITGIEVYDILRNSYNIQLEYGDLSNMLAIISLGDTLENANLLIKALQDISNKYKKEAFKSVSDEYINPVVKYSPREAFYHKKENVKIVDSLGKVSGEFVMNYPPGIPVLAPGELITKEALDYIAHSKSSGTVLTGTEDEAVEWIKVLKEE